MVRMKKPKFTAKDLFTLESSVLGATTAEIADLVGESEYHVHTRCRTTRDRLMRMEGGSVLQYKHNRSIQHDAMDWIEAINVARGLLDGR